MSDKDIDGFSEDIESSSDEEGWGESQESSGSSVKSDFLSEFKLRSSSGLPFPGSSKSGGEGGTDDGPVGGFGDLCHIINDSKVEPLSSSDELGDEECNKESKS